MEKNDIEYWMKEARTVYYYLYYIRLWNETNLVRSIKRVREETVKSFEKSTSCFKKYT